MKPRIRLVVRLGCMLAGLSLAVIAAPVMAKGKPMLSVRAYDSDTGSPKKPALVGLVFIRNLATGRTRAWAKPGPAEFQLVPDGVYQITFTGSCSDRASATCRKERQGVVFATLKNGEAKRIRFYINRLPTVHLDPPPTIRAIESSLAKCDTDTAAGLLADLKRLREMLRRALDDLKQVQPELVRNLLIPLPLEEEKSFRTIVDNTLALPLEEQLRVLKFLMSQRSDKIKNDILLRLREFVYMKKAHAAKYELVKKAIQRLGKNLPTTKKRCSATARPASPRAHSSGTSRMNPPARKCRRGGLLGGVDCVDKRMDQ